MPMFPIPLIARPNNGISIYLVVPASNGWKTFDRKHIPFLDREDPEHVKLVCQTILEQLAYLEGFFLKKASTKMPESRSRYNAVLELREDAILKKTPYYSTPSQYLLLEKEHIDKLLRLGFIERCIDNDLASTLFISKPHFANFQYCIDYCY